VAEKTHTPIGFLFLTEPPEQELSVADFRQARPGERREPSLELLDTLQVCEQRQQWFREYVTTEGQEPLQFVGSANPNEAPESIARRIRETLQLDAARRAAFATWVEALRDLFEKVEAIGILVMRNGVVGNNTHRRLSVDEFRGFSLSDPWAPLIFVNAADAKSAQMFSVAHELAHIWRGESGISDDDPRSRVPEERFCNQVAAELLVPGDDLLQQWRRRSEPQEEAARLARAFKVSSLVMLIRARELELIDDESFQALYADERTRARAPTEEGGGDFYRTQRSRLGRRFATAVIASAIEGRTTYKEAFRLLGVRKSATFEELARNLGVIG